MPTPGKHTLTYEISNDIPESQDENNVLVHTKTVEDESTIPGFGLWAVLMTFAIVVAVLLVRRR